MFYSEKVKVYSDAPSAAEAAELFRNELKIRTGFLPAAAAAPADADFIFALKNEVDRDAYEIETAGEKVTFLASGIRGFVFAAGLFLRKIRAKDGGFELCTDIGGKYAPQKQIRGHQLGYRTTPNTYDAWTYADYYRYYIDLMFFGCNTVEHIPYEDGKSRRNRLMRYDEEEFLLKACEMADDLDLNVSLWHPNRDDETHESAAKQRGELYSKLKRLDFVFIPGGDPGDLPADVFVNRCIAISRELKKSHPEAQLWPSAQAPHSIPGWGEVFVAELKKQLPEIDGVIYGPNHAFPLDVLCEKLEGKYPMRFYPDITHNVRCEYPVHFDRDDWHFVLTTGLSRECTNPRPVEYTHLHNITESRFIGSVSYSEGVTDDVNKCIWSALDWDKDSDPKETLKDYSRLYFFGADEERIADAILALEKNWEGNTDKNEIIDGTYAEFVSLYNEYDFLHGNWRFIQLYLRAVCDRLLRFRRLDDLKAIEKAKALVCENKVEEAKSVLLKDYGKKYDLMREKVNEFTALLFGLIGYQSDVENYCADNWERGAILETIDLPVSDRKWLLSKFEKTADKDELLEYFNRDNVNEGELHFSVALDGIKEKQSGEVYMNFRGDRPGVNDGTLPTSLFNIFDNLSFIYTAEDLCDGCDYELHVTYLDDSDERITEHKITANGNVIYCGKQFGTPDPEYDEKFGRKGFVSAKYVLPGNCISGGKTRLEFSEPNMGVMIAEFSLRKK